MMRIIAGQFRGTKLNTPQDNAIRPTTDRVRENLFNLINSQFTHHWHNKKVLDLFAGTGALGLEALSRGASAAIFVDSSLQAHGLIRSNIVKLGLGGRTQVLRSDATALGPAVPDAPFQLIFADPPYGQTLGEKALCCTADQGWIDSNALIILEQAKGIRIVLPSSFEPVDQRTYAQTHIAVYRYKG